MVAPSARLADYPGVESEVPAKETGSSSSSFWLQVWPQIKMGPTEYVDYSLSPTTWDNSTRTESPQNPAASQVGNSRDMILLRRREGEQLSRL